MAIAFSRSSRSLQADSFRRPLLGIVIGVLLLGAWGAWFFLARVSVHEMSEFARLEVERSVHPIETSIGGRVVVTGLGLGQEVQAGDVLVELDSTTQRLQLQEHQALLRGLGTQLDALRREIQAAEQTARDQKRAAAEALKEMQGKQKEAETAAQFAEEEWKRKEKSGIPEIDVLRLKAEAERLKAAAETARLAGSRLEWEHRAKESDHQVALIRLAREGAKLEGEISVGEATVRRLEDEIARRRILAPISGTVGEVAAFRVGGVVKEGDRLGAIVPPGTLRAVAEFPPSAALGKIRAGQKARLRLEGFPWTQYGSVSATVGNVASEVRDGKVRVEFVVHPEGSAIPLQHGLPGAVEIEVERVSPATLVLRAAGRLVGDGR